MSGGVRKKERKKKRKKKAKKEYYISKFSGSSVPWKKGNNTTL
jgi:hypothetical protein